MTPAKPIRVSSEESFDSERRKSFPFRTQSHILISLLLAVSTTPGKASLKEPNPHRKIQDRRYGKS